MPNFRGHIESCYITFHKTSNKIFEAIELGLGLPAGSLLDRACHNLGELRLNHYPSISRQELLTQNTRRIWPHTDFGTISLLFQDTAGGLEFEDRSKAGTFVPVVSENPSDLIITVADILQRWTNDVLKAGLHRVSVPQQFQVHDMTEDCWLPERYSIVFFCRPREDESAGPIQNFLSDERQALYDEISALEHLEKRNK